MSFDTTIKPINPNTFALQNYNVDADVLIKSSTLDTVFNSETDILILTAYDLNGNRVYPSKEGIADLAYYGNPGYTVIEGDILINPIDDLENIGLDVGVFNSIYNFYRPRLASDQNNNYYISYRYDYAQKIIRSKLKIIKLGIFLMTSYVIFNLYNYAYLIYYR